MAQPGAAVGDRVGGLVRERFKAFLAEYKYEIAAGESSQGQAEEVLVRGARTRTRTHAHSHPHPTPPPTHPRTPGLRAPD